MNINFSKTQGLVPVIIQHAMTFQVLMLGYMNEEAYLKTQKEGMVSFFSRSKNRIWTKGETSGNFLHVKKIMSDCDNDTLLIQVIPEGVVCHTGTATCFNEETDKGFLYQLEHTITQRIQNKTEHSYTKSLVKRGINKVAQKVGEEAVEVVIEAKDNNKHLFINETADLLYHLLVLMHCKDTSLQEVEQLLASRANKTK